VIAAPDSELRFALLSLYDDYAAALDDDLERWPELFTEEGIYRVIARENFERGMLWPTMSCHGRGMLRDRVTAIRQTSVYTPRQMRHVVSGIRILGEASNGYRTQATFLVGESGPDTESRMYAIGRYIDVVERDSDAASGFRFADKMCVYDGNLILSTLIYPL
jgi:3-phenylpropionate/cinnamic acid dioxygenase small subunit